MIATDQALKLQAYNDAELPENEAQQLEVWLKSQPDAKALLNELRMTSQALATSGLEKDIKLPESREFYWNKIQKEISRLEPAPASQAEAEDGIFALLRRFLVPAGAIAVTVIAALLGANEFGFFGTPIDTQVESAVADPGAFTYRDYAAKTTLVWLTYPAEKEFADYDDPSTIDPE